jgi:predicted NAD/FAD-binding protein
MNTMTSTPAKSIAVVGGGVAGLSAAWILAQRHKVTLFEAQSRLGGHTHTITIEDGPDAGTPIDTGFIVCNDRNYENFHIFLERLACRVRNADMSFGYEDRASGLQYSGASLLGLFASPSYAVRPSHWAMLSQIQKFMKAGREAMAHDSGPEGSLGDFLIRAQIGEAAIQHYVLPMGAAIWSAPRE